MAQSIPASDIGNVHGYSISNARYIRKVATVFGDHTIDQENLGAEIEQAPCKRGADEAQPAGNHCPSPCVDIQGHIWCGRHSCPVIKGRSEALGHARQNPHSKSMCDSSSMRKETEARLRGGSGTV